jgi:hypothetical protein
LIEIRKPTREDIDLVTFDDEIWQKTSYDNCPNKEELRTNYDFYSYFEFWGCYLNNKIIALATVGNGGNFHFEVLKPYRKHAKIALNGFLTVLNRDLFCEIPLLYKEVINFAKKNGFKEEGEILGRKFTKNGIDYKLIKLSFNNE